MNAPHYFDLHPKYPAPGNVIAQTLADVGHADGIQWRNPDGNAG